MEIVRLGVVEGPSDYSEEAVLEVDVELQEGDDLRRHRMSAFYELVTETVRECRDPHSERQSHRPVGRSWQRSAQELVAYTITGLHRAAGMAVESRAVAANREQWRIVIQPAGSRATRRAVELATEAFRDFSAGRSVDIKRSVDEIRKLCRYQ